MDNFVNDFDRIIYEVSISEYSPKDAGFRQLKYEWSLPDFWTLKHLVEYKSKKAMAAIEDAKEEAQSGNNS